MTTIPLYDNKVILPCDSTGAKDGEHRGEHNACGGAPAGSGSRHILTNCNLPIETDSSDDRYFGDVLGKIIDSPQLESHYDDVVEFQRWLKKVNNLTILLKGYTHYPDGKTGGIDPFTQIEYSKKSATRWSDDYVKTVLARLYKLKEVLKDTPVLMGSFTCPHEYNIFVKQVNPGLDIPTCFDILRKAWPLFRAHLHKRFHRTIQVVRIWEPHDMGYPHFHAIFIGRFTDSDKEWMAATWADCIRYPSAKEHALNWSKTTSIEFPVAYLMKYMTKTLYHTYSSWDAPVWVFNAVAWKHRIRLFQTSVEIGRLIADDKRDDSDTVYTEVMAVGLPRRTIYNADYNNDLPALISTPKKSLDIYAREAVLNPTIVPFVPLRARTDLPPVKPVAARAKDFLYRQNCWSAIRFLDTVYDESKDCYYQSKLWDAAAKRPQLPIMKPLGGV